MKNLSLKIHKEWSLPYLLTILFFVMITSTANATMRHITVSSNQFSPTITSAVVGDTIRWQWIDGSHTTTSISVPGGAATWDAPMESGTPVFMYKITVAGTYQYQCNPHAPDMNGTINATVSGISQNGTGVPEVYALKQNYPNPFNPSTNINFSVAGESYVTLSVFNIAGQEVASLVSQNMQTGNYTVDWNAEDLTTGVYFYRLEANMLNGSEKYIDTKKMMLVK